MSDNESYQLHEAVKIGDAAKIELLLMDGESPNTENEDGLSPIHVICQTDKSREIHIDDRLHILNILWKYGAQMNRISKPKNKVLPCQRALHFAVKSKLVEVTSFLLKNGANPNGLSTGDRTALHYLASGEDVGFKECEAIIGLLLSYGANLHALDSANKTPLMEAAKSGNHNIAKLLIKAGAQVDYKNRLGLTALFYGCENLHFNVIKTLLPYSTNVNIKDHRRRSTMLHFLAGTGRFNKIRRDDNSRTKILRLLAHNGAILDLPDVEGSTALHLATEVGNLRMVETLLELGVNVNSEDGYGNTALHVLLKHGADDGIEIIAKILIEKGASVNALNTNLETPLHLAVWRGSEEIVSNLLSHGADYRAFWYLEICNFKILRQLKKVIDVDAVVPLTVAATLGHLEIVNILLDCDNCLKINNDILTTSFFGAVMNGHFEVAKTLLDAGCYINRKITNITTVLHEAVRSGNTALIHLILESGADINAKNIYRQSALDFALAYDENKALVLHYAKENFQNSNENKEDLNLIYLNERLMEFMKMCCSELTKMKEDILHDNFSVYKLLFCQIDYLRVVLSNMKADDLLFVKDLEEKYPLYSELLKIRFNLAFERIDLYSCGSMYLNKAFKDTFEELGYVSIPDEIIEKILYYFTPRDLKKLRC